MSKERIMLLARGYVPTTELSPDSKGVIRDLDTLFGAEAGSKEYWETKSRILTYIIPNFRLFYAGVGSARETGLAIELLDEILSNCVERENTI